MHQDINIRGIDAQRPELGDLESDTALQIMLAYFLCNYIILSLHCVRTDLTLFGHAFTSRRLMERRDG
jgi:hypothetical protein